MNTCQSRCNAPVGNRHCNRPCGHADDHKLLSNKCACCGKPRAVIASDGPKCIICMNHKVGA